MLQRINEDARASGRQSLLARVYKRPEPDEQKATGQEWDDDDESQPHTDTDITQRELDEDEAYEHCIETHGYCSHDRHEGP